MNSCLCFRLVCFLAQNGWMCCSRLSHSWPSVHPIILQTQHNLALVTQLLCFARRFSHVSLLHVRFVWKTGQRCASPSHQTFTSCGTLECGKMQTEAKMMPDFGGGGDTWKKQRGWGGERTILKKKMDGWMWEGNAISRISCEFNSNYLSWMGVDVLYCLLVERWRHQTFNNTCKWKSVSYN